MAITYTNCINVQTNILKFMKIPNSFKKYAINLLSKIKLIIPLSLFEVDLQRMVLLF